MDTKRSYEVNGTTIDIQGKDISCGGKPMTKFDLLHFLKVQSALLFGSLYGIQYNMGIPDPTGFYNALQTKKTIITLLKEIKTL